VLPSTTQALLCSIWTTDVSGSIALLGLFAVYMASQELLMLFMVFIPASILVDFMRGFGGKWVSQQHVVVLRVCKHRTTAVLNST
jgi:hypothetical protein